MRNAVNQYLEHYHAALTAIDRLEVASAMVPSQAWFLYGFVRKEAVVSSQIGGIKPTINKAIGALVEARIFEELTGKQRDRIYAYRNYLNVLAEDTETPIE